MNPWPFNDLVLVDDDLTLRPVTDQDALGLAQLAEVPLVPPGKEHWLPWLVTRPASPEERAVAFLQYHWGCRSRLHPQDWTVSFAVHLFGVLAGIQTIHSHQFAVGRVINTGSWLGAPFQGQGIGARMRAMVLELGFAHLGAHYFISDYVMDNQKSAAVSKKLGYELNGVHVDTRVRNGVMMQDVILSVERWRVTRPGWLDEMVVDNLEPCRALLGA